MTNDDTMFVIGTQMTVFPCCMLSLMYSKLSRIPQGTVPNGAPVDNFVSGVTPVVTEWGSTYGCTEDMTSCCLVSCTPCTFGVSRWCLIKGIGERIGTEEALAAVSHCVS